MRKRLESYVQRLVMSTGYVISRSDAVPRDIEPVTAATIGVVRPYTMTSAARIEALCQAVRYIVRNEVPGAIVECGVWRGGSMMAVARTLLEQAETSRLLYLFDTFEGMVPPGPKDRFRDGALASEIFERENKKSAWCYAPLDEVRSLLRSTGYEDEKVHYIVGRVEDTLPYRAPQTISVLRLDTDWYESTRHELETLYPRLAPGGILLIDDYGYWQGARRAVDEYFDGLEHPPLLTRVDDSARLAVIPGELGRRRFSSEIASP